MTRIPVYRVSIPEYHVRAPPDHHAVGKRIDAVLRRHFLGKKVAIRCLSSSEHRMTRKRLIGIIRRLGTDRYDPGREGDRYGNVEGKRIDIFCLERTITPKARIMWQFVWSFSELAKRFGSRPIRIDIVIVYDRRRLTRVRHTYSDGRRKSDGFVFKGPGKKRDAILGIVEIG